MRCITLHNFCIFRDDPYEPGWKLEVQKLSLTENYFLTNENKELVDLTCLNVPFDRT